jgi:hypothetical protein
MSFARVISGDGKQVFRRRIDLADTEGFGARKLQIPIDLEGRTWVRFEAWDIAANGAFTQPVWLGGAVPSQATPAAVRATGAGDVGTSRARARR